MQILQFVKDLYNQFRIRCVLVLPLQVPDVDPGSDDFGPTRRRKFCCQLSHRYSAVGIHRVDVLEVRSVLQTHGKTVNSLVSQRQTLDGRP